MYNIAICEDNAVQLEQIRNLFTQFSLMKMLNLTFIHFLQEKTY